MEASISLKTAAENMGCSTEQVRRMINDGSLRGWRFKREIRVFVSSISDYQTQNKIIPKKIIDHKKENRGSTPKIKILTKELANLGLL